MRSFTPALAQYFVRLVFFLLLVLLCCLSFLSIPTPLPSKYISQKISGLHQIASIWVPHFEIDNGQLRQQYRSLFEKVEQHIPLSDEECESYRKIYQQLLFKDQRKFSLFDAQLSFVDDLAMTEKNNVGGLGVEGRHDHHDMSSRNNFSEIAISVNYLQQYPHDKDWGFSWRRVGQAIGIYKNLNDLLFHLATVPHTKSVSYMAQDSHSEPMQQLFESMLFHFKQAQFLTINTPEYNRQLVLALDKYRELIEMNQAIIYQSLSPLELKLAGNWGSWRSLTPKVSDQSTQNH